MANEINDEKILSLKKQILEKKALLTKVARFAPITNCSVELQGEKYNINVLNKDQLILLMIELNLYNMSAKDLGLNTLDISGYSINDWMADIKSKLEVISYKEEESKLKVMESKLDKLLSNEKKTELEIDEIAALLK